MQRRAAWPTPATIFVPASLVTGQPVAPTTNTSLPNDWHTLVLAAATSLFLVEMEGQREVAVGRQKKGIDVICWPTGHRTDGCLADSVFVVVVGGWGWPKTGRKKKDPRIFQVYTAPLKACRKRRKVPKGNGNRFGWLVGCLFFPNALFFGGGRTKKKGHDDVVSCCASSPREDVGRQRSVGSPQVEHRPTNPPPLVGWWGEELSSSSLFVV